ncbi:MAG: hypothetical protein RPU60_16655 [Candidatus Sedimenticola sp. (ex Thyasira tokunagai)]
MARSEEEKQQLLIKLSEDDFDHIVRPERNIERWSNFIFPHARAQCLNKKRTKEWSIKLPDGRPAQGSISIEPVVDQKAYTYRTYDVYLALTHIWYELGMPEDIFTVSLRDIARAMEVPLNGKWSALIMSELECLYKTVLSWRLSFKTLENEQETVKNQHILETFNYMALNERASLENRFKASCQIRFDQKIRDNLREKQTIPVNWTVRKSIKSQLAKVFYGRVDNILAGQIRYERGAINLLDDLQISGVKEYQYKSRRKRLVDMLQAELDGVTLSSGAKLEVEVKKTVDGSDWKICCARKAARLSGGGINKHLPIVNNDKDNVEYLVKMMGDEVGGLEENYGLYKMIAQRYSETLIYRALAEYREELSSSIKFKRRFFTIKVHLVAHKMGKEWIKPCSKTCKYRPENNLPLIFSGTE